MSSSIQFVLCALAIWVMTSSVMPRSTILKAGRGGFDSGRMFDKYGVLPLKEENDHLDNLAIQLRKEPRSKGYVVIYGSEDHVGDLKARACRAIRHLVSQGHVDPKQVVAMMIGGSHREELTVELWMWPIEAPDDLPRFQLGVNDEGVSIIRGTENVKRCGRRRS